MGKRGAVRLAPPSDLLHWLWGGAFRGFTVALGFPLLPGSLPVLSPRPRHWYMLGKCDLLWPHNGECRAGNHGTEAWFHGLCRRSNLFPSGAVWMSFLQSVKIFANHNPMGTVRLYPRIPRAGHEGQAHCQHLSGRCTVHPLGAKRQSAPVQDLSKFNAG